MSKTSLSSFGVQAESEAALLYLIIYLNALVSLPFIRCMIVKQIPSAILKTVNTCTQTSLGRIWGGPQERVRFNALSPSALASGA